MALKTIKQLRKIEGKVVLLRIDLNFDISSIKSLDETRLPYYFPTIKALRDKNAKIVILSHLGRPKGKKVKKYSLKFIISRINKEYNLKIKFCENDILRESSKIQEKIKNLKNGEIIALENLRYYKGEEANDIKFSKALALLGDIYVNDAFAVCHRKHASVCRITKYLPSYAGLLIVNEVKQLKVALKPKKKSITILGGAKLETKLKLLTELLKKYDYVALGSGPAKVFWHIQGFNYGKKDRTLTPEVIKVAKKLLQKYKEKILLPSDVIVSSKISHNSKAEYKTILEIKKNDIVLDIGPQTITTYSCLIKDCNTILWNGPVGLFEIPSFRHGTIALARIIGARSKGLAYGMAGGGETLIAIKQANVDQYIDFISTGGGAMLEYLYDQDLPGLVVLQK